MPRYPKEDLWELYENLPKELKNAVFSEKNSEIISNICERNNIVKSKEIAVITENIGYILLGLIEPIKIQQILENEANLPKEKAKQISLEIIRFILFPLKASLEELYQVEVPNILKPKINDSEKKESLPLPAEKTGTGSRLVSLLKYYETRSPSIYRKRIKNIRPLNF